MRITVKKVLAYICSVCIIDSAILCIYVSTNHDKQTEIFQSASLDSIDLPVVDFQPIDKPYFMNEPHFERLIKEYRDQEEDPRRVLFENDNNSDEELKSNNSIGHTYQQNTASHKVNSEKLRWFENSKQGNRSRAGVQTDEYRGSIQPRGNDRPASNTHSPPTVNGINKVLGINQAIKDQADMKMVHPQASENLRPPVKVTHLGRRIEQKTTLEIKKPKQIVLLQAERRQNQPIYVKYIKLANNELQPVPVDRRSLELNQETKLAQKRDEIVSLDESSPHQQPYESPGVNKPSSAVGYNQNLDDIFLAVKTTQKYHRSRLQVLLDTWVSIVPNQVYFFTDADDEEFQQKTNGHMINTNCPSLHVRAALCCKMTAMFDSFMESTKSWFCHVDDDNYLNIGELRKLLDLFQPHQQDVYLGRSSTLNPIEAYNTLTPMKKDQFWFGTGGAGVCLSRALAKKMIPYISGGKMQFTCESIRMPDDVTIGYINEVLLNVPMLHIKQMNSHLQELWAIKQKDIKNQITLSYRMDGSNMIALHNPAFPFKDDPTRFKSIHCMLYPLSSFCPNKQV